VTEETPLTKAIVEATPSAAEGVRAAAVVEKAIEADPVLQNALGQERWWQSGIQWFGTGGVLWGVGFILTEVSVNGVDLKSYDFVTMLSAIGGVVSGVGVLYRRFVPGLRPFFIGWFGT
jgi:hypothetical protein